MVKNCHASQTHSACDNQAQTLTTLGPLQRLAKRLVVDLSSLDLK